DYGNLFTGDNDHDPGDQPRLVHLVEGGDSGWVIHGNLGFSEMPWIVEHLWQTQWDGQAAYIVPPIATLTTNYGPSGFAFYPVTGLAERYANHFFICNFGYNASKSSVDTFTLKPKGASFSVEDYRKFMSLLVPTDVEFAVDGGLFVTAWEDGGNPSYKNH